MRTRVRNNQNSGFTMVEMLATVAILVILLGITMVSVVRYRDLLKLTELDNAAREIYMAAENRAVLLSGAQRLNNLVETAGEETALIGYDWRSDDEDLRYVAKSVIGEDLLAIGNVDPALREPGVDFYIVYDQKSGSVTDVFYAESSMTELVGSNFAEFYKKWATSRSQRLTLKNEKLVGWYNGMAAQIGEVETPPEGPIVIVTILNEEELTVKVEYKNVPGPATLSVKLGNKDLSRTIPLPNDRRQGTLPPGVVSSGAGKLSIPAGSGSFTWTLDSLTRGQFKDIDGIKEVGGPLWGVTTYVVTPGDDFTVEATLTGDSFEEVSDRETDNSLFQKGSGLIDEDGGQVRICYIGYLRHLQNLNYSSGVPSTELDAKSRAIQTADILGYTNETYPEYNFIPISNGTITKYDGRSYEIRNLYVNHTDAAGLFEKTNGNMVLQYIRMVNATIRSEDRSVGALAGEAYDTTIDNCWVYWEPDEGVSDLREVLGSDADGYEFERKGIFGNIAGGLVGVAGGGTRITNSLAATLVKGGAYAGGLAGQASGTATIQNSYADCYLTGDINSTSSKVAGLIGQNDGNVTLTNCYAAGYITGGKSAAGLCGGAGTTTAKNVYSVMRYPTRGAEDKFAFLTENPKNDTLANTHFWGDFTQSVVTKDGTVITGETYAQMTDRGDGSDPQKNGFATTMGDGSFEWKIYDPLRDAGDPLNSNPYNLREYLTLYAYSFPGLKNLPHYGDWGAEFKEPSLVYYEQYNDSWGVSGGNARDLINSLSNQKTVLSDGYGVAFRKEDLPEGGTPTLTCTYYDDQWVKQENVPVDYGALIPTSWKNDDGSTAEYYLIPLPEDWVNSAYAQDCFYRYLKFELDLGGASGEYFFNPHFAETVMPIISDSGAEGNWTAERVQEQAGLLAGAMGEVKVRTPRHLYDLSQFREYYTRQSTFRQILDLDYSTYIGYNLFTGQKPYAQQPIGRYSSDNAEAFRGTYDGACHVIRNVTPKVEDTAKRQYAGLFGYSTGTLRNIVYEMDPNNQVTAYLGSTANSLYVGALAGGSAGTIDNCAVYGANLRAGASGVSLYVGGLVGQNRGTVRNCSAESARLSANCFSYARIYIGGLVGENTKSQLITTSYAVGRIDAEVDSTITTARICGFVGWNSGYITNSYAAVDLQSSGENVEAYGFCGQKDGDQSGTGYLDQGNFRYRDTSYAANYKRVEPGNQDKAQSVTYARLSGSDTDPFTVSGMGKAQRSPQKDGESEALYPYPAVVKNGDGELVHYGRWPTPMPLGKMGVFYWEKMVDADWQQEIKNGADPQTAGSPTYHISALAVDPKNENQEERITKQSTLSEAHNDGRVVVEYGYGYYAENDANVTLKSRQIAYIEYQTYGHRERLLNPNHNDFLQYGNTISNGEISVNNWPQDEAANSAMNTLMDGYSFHCWNTYHEGPRGPADNGDSGRTARQTRGLTLFKSGEYDVLNPNGGSFVLTQTSSGGNITVDFCVNPQFADAMSVNSITGFADGSVFRTKPGTTKDNSYQIRCGMQLQDINWYDTAYTDVPVEYPRDNGLPSYGAYRFPYLSNGDGTNGTYKRSYYWKQTHDLDWTAEGNTYQASGSSETQAGVFYTLAQGRGNESSLTGWFSGTYNGQNYTIKNLNIDINTTYNTNCIGLFGAVQNATLENIVLYSESGNDAVTVRGRTDTTGNNAWYAGGVLAGVARSSTISNCAVAGYTVKDVTTRARSVQEWAGYNSYYTMGGAIGGLVGMTDRELKGCAAAATIEIGSTSTACNHQNNNNGLSAPIRVGGLVGSTTANVTNCYTGGEIKIVNAKNVQIYAGRIIGGLGGGPFGGEDRNAQTTVSSCYSYLTLPSGTNNVVQARYNIGGPGRGTNAPAGTVTTNNDYYYGTNVNAGGGTSVTYRQLSDPSIYDKLTAYEPVTSELRGITMSGRFSYVPANQPKLQGLDYPFPTILTQPQDPDNPDGAQYRVHYGEWPLRGIERANGGAPIELDMFTRRTNAVDGTGEQLTLTTGVAAGGSWSVTWAWEDKEEKSNVGDFVTVTVNGGNLIATAKKASRIPVIATVSYTEPGNGETYTLSVKIYITDNLELRPTAVRIFPNDTVTVSLAAWGVEPGEKDYEPLPDGGTLTVTGIDPADGLVAAEPAESGVKLTRAGDDSTGTLRLDVTYTYTQDGYTKGGGEEAVAHRVDVDLLTLPAGAWDEKGTVWTVDFANEEYTIKDMNQVPPDPEGCTVTVNGTVITLTRTNPATPFPKDGVPLTVTFTLDDLTHTLTLTVPPRPEEGKDTKS